MLLQKELKKITPGESVTEATFKNVKDKIRKFASKLRYQPMSQLQFGIKW